MVEFRLMLLTVIDLLLKLRWLSLASIVLEYNRVSPFWSVINTFLSKRLLNGLKLTDSIVIVVFSRLLKFSAIVWAR